MAAENTAAIQDVSKFARDAGLDEVTEDDILELTDKTSFFAEELKEDFIWSNTWMHKYRRRTKMNRSVL